MSGFADRSSELLDQQISQVWRRSDLSRKQQAAALGLSTSQLYRRADRLGLPVGRVRTIPAARIREVWLNHELTLEEAANAVGLAEVNLYLRAKSMGLPPRPIGPTPKLRRGEPERLFVAMWEAPVNLHDIARHFGLKDFTVRAQARRLGLARRPRTRPTLSLAAFWELRRMVAIRDAMTKFAVAENAALASMTVDCAHRRPADLKPQSVLLTTCDR